MVINYDNSHAIYRGTENQGQYLSLRGRKLLGQGQKADPTATKIYRRKIREHISSAGNFVLLTNQKEMDKMEALDHYRRRDRVEKVLNTVKNEMDGGRLRAHGSFNNDGRLFVKFVALMLYAEISKIMH